MCVHYHTLFCQGILLLWGHSENQLLYRFPDETASKSYKESANINNDNLKIPTAPLFFSSLLGLCGEHFATLVLISPLSFSKNGDEVRAVLTTMEREQLSQASNNRPSKDSIHAWQRVNQTAK